MSVLKKGYQRKIVECKDCLKDTPNKEQFENIKNMKLDPKSKCDILSTNKSSTFATSMAKFPRVPKRRS